MAPKRRKAPEETLDQEVPKKRLTRSAGKPTVSTGQDTATQQSKADKKQSPRASRKSKSDSAKTSTTSASKAATRHSTKPSTTKKSNTMKPVPKAENTTPETQNLTITSPLVKSSIQCQIYTPSLSSLTLSSSSGTLIFTHGAGGTISAAAVVHFCTGYSARYPILAFDGSMNLSARKAGFHACIEHISGAGEGKKEKKQEARSVMVFGGRSMGARAAVLAGSEMAEGGKNRTRIQLILASYPLRSPKGDVRDAILLTLPAEIQVLFVIGDADNMCPLDLLGSVRAKMKAKSQLVVVRGADHGMNVKPARRTKEVGEETGRLAAEWVDGKLGDDVVYIGEEKGK